VCARVELLARRMNAARAKHAGVPLVLHLLLLAFSLAAPPAAAQPTLRGVQDSEGNAVVLPEPGAVTVVQFMATWCAPCHEQTRALVELHPTYAARGIRIAAVSFDRTAEHHLLPIYAEEFAVPYPLLVGGTLAMLKGFVSGDTLPAVVIFDRDGQVFDTVAGLVSSDVLTARLNWLTSSRTSARPQPFVPPPAAREEDELPHVHAAAMLARQGGRRAGSLVPS
jgi:thiol-disulfide isomerase/thioredoxin